MKSWRGARRLSTDIRPKIETFARPLKTPGGLPEPLDGGTARRPRLSFASGRRKPRLAFVSSGPAGARLGRAALAIASQRQERYIMSGFWMSISAAQKTAAGNKPASSRYYVFQILAGICLALLIGAVLFIAAAFLS